jgi:hypothetical protein
MNKGNTKTNINEGWIKLFRSIRKHWIWNDPTKLKRWLDIILEVNHEDRKVNIGNEIIDCKRGQTVMSLRSWATRWCVSKDSARHFIGLLQKDGMIITKSLAKTTRITVTNYDIYQHVTHDGETMARQSRDSRETVAIPKQELKELKNKNKENPLFKKKEKLKVLNVDAAVEFYASQAAEAKKYSDTFCVKYLEFARFVCQKNNDGTWRLNHFLMMNHPLSLEEFRKLYIKSGENLEKITSKASSLHTNFKYHGKYSDVYLTINNWLTPRD